MFLQITQNCCFHLCRRTDVGKFCKEHLPHANDFLCKFGESVGKEVELMKYTELDRCKVSYLGHDVIINLILGPGFLYKLNFISATLDLLPHQRVILIESVIPVLD